ncbi:Chromosome transmission fidelity protein 18 [Sorochytrium milnesiophthora]
MEHDSAVPERGNAAAHRPAKRTTFFDDLLEDADLEMYNSQLDVGSRQPQDETAVRAEDVAPIPAAIRKPGFFDDLDDQDMEPAEEDIDPEDYDGQIDPGEEYAQMHDAFAMDDDDEEVGLPQERDATMQRSKIAKILGAPVLPPLAPQNTVAPAPSVDYRQLPDVGSCIRASSSSGARLYFPRRYESTRRPRGTGRPASLLGTNIHNMIRELDNDIALTAHRTLSVLQNMENALSATTAPDAELWVDKYRPHSYLELVGDESTSRDVLTWLKDWDACVFHRQQPTRAKKRKVEDLKPWQKQDPYHRPDRKILLMSGPPGLGKTTMAHVVARQAGYNVVEINASDTRTGTAVRDKLSAALSMRAISKGQTQQAPNVLVLDEIDGVSNIGGEQSFVKLLVDLATAADGDAKRGKKVKKSSTETLRRPIICICNDVYTPALRPLRAVAKMCTLRKPTIMQLCKRLAEICKLEGLATDSRALANLVTMADADMRTCLNTLQFVRQKSRSLTMTTLNEIQIGSKDMSASLFAIWEEIFQLPTQKKLRHQHATSNGQTNTGRGYVDRLVKLMSTDGEYERILQGCFENYAHVRFRDPSMQKLVALFDHVHAYDQLSHRTFGSLGGELEGYLPYLLTNFHRYLASGMKPPLEYPRADYEAFVALRDRKNIVRSLFEHTPPHIQRHLSPALLAQEVLPSFARIVTPPVKATVKAQDRTVLDKVVQVLACYQIKLVQERHGDGQQTFRMEPPVTSLCVLDGAADAAKAVLPASYAVRQYLAQQLEQLHVRHAAEAFTASVTPKPAAVAATKRSRVDKVTVDFFGRVLEVSPQSSVDELSDTHVARQKQPRIAFRFNEGYSNAVRRNISVQEFL